MLAAATIFAASFFILVLGNVITSSLSGLVLTYALQMTSLFQYAGIDFSHSKHTHTHSLSIVIFKL
jgi:hypothetical protein